MILFAGIPSEPPLALAIEAAQRASLPYVVFNQRQTRACELAIESTDQHLRGCLWTEGRSWHLDEFSGIYARLMDPSVLPESRPPSDRATHPDAVEKALFLHEALNDWLEIAPGRIVNRPSAMASNSSKPYQTQLIAQYGFLIPPTLVTNDPALVEAFHAQHRRVIYKSTSAHRSIVTEWHPRGSDELKKVRTLPTQFQALLVGMNVRVHVIGDRVFASEILTDALDYRYAHRDGHDNHMRPLELPGNIAEQCAVMTGALGLEFSGIDLLRTCDDQWYCFEVNTSPGYSYFQEQTGQPISEALVARLSTH